MYEIIFILSGNGKITTRKKPRNATWKDKDNLELGKDYMVQRTYFENK